MMVSPGSLGRSLKLMEADHTTDRGLVTHLAIFVSIARTHRYTPEVLASEPNLFLWQHSLTSI